MKLSAFIKLLQIPVGRVKSCGQSQVIRPSSSVKYNEPCSVGKDIYLGDRIVNTTGADIIIDLGDDNEYKIKGYSAECVAPKYGDPNMPKLLDGLKEITDQTENFTTGVVDDPNDKVIFVVNFLYEKLKEAKGSNLVDGDNLSWYYKKFVRKYANDKKIQKSRLVNTNYAQNMEDDLQNTVFIFEGRDEIITASGDFLDKDSDLSFDGGNLVESQNISDEVERIIESQTEASRKLESLIAQISDDNVHEGSEESDVQTLAMLEKLDEIEEKRDVVFGLGALSETPSKEEVTSEVIDEDDSVIEITLEDPMFAQNEETLPIEEDSPIYINSDQEIEETLVASELEEPNKSEVSSVEIETAEEKILALALRAFSEVEKDKDFGVITKIEAIDSSEIAKETADILNIEADAGSQVMYSVMKDEKIIQGGVSLSDGRISLVVENIELAMGDKLSFITINPLKGSSDRVDFVIEKIRHNDKSLPDITIKSAKLIDESIPADSIPERLEIVYELSKDKCEVVFRHEGEILYTAMTDKAGEYHASLKIDGSKNIKPRSNIGVNVIDLAGNTLYDAFEVDAQMDYSDLNFAKIVNANAKVVEYENGFSTVEINVEASRTGVDVEAYFKGEILKTSFMDHSKISFLVRGIDIGIDDEIEILLKEKSIPYAKAWVKVDTSVISAKLEEERIYGEIKAKEEEARLIADRIKEVEVSLDEVEDIDDIAESIDKDTLELVTAMGEAAQNVISGTKTPSVPEYREDIIVQKEGVIEQGVGELDVKEFELKPILNQADAPHLKLIYAKLIDVINDCDFLEVKGETNLPNSAVYINDDFRIVASGATDDVGNFCIKAPAKYNITTKTSLKVEIAPHGGVKGVTGEIKMEDEIESRYIQRLDRKNQISFVRDITKDGVINASEQTGGVTLARIFLADNVMVGDVIKISVSIEGVVVSCEEIILSQSNLDSYVETLVPVKEGKLSELSVQIVDRFGNQGDLFIKEIKKVTSIPNVSVKNLRLVQEYDGTRLALFASTDKANCSYTVEHGDGTILASGYCDISGELVAKIRTDKIARHDLLILGVADEHHNAGYEEVYVDMDIPADKGHIESVILGSRQKQKLNIEGAFAPKEKVKDLPGV